MAEYTWTPRNTIIRESKEYKDFREKLQRLKDHVKVHPQYDPKFPFETTQEQLVKETLF